ncbi:hypothetical protein DENSPDRAFT_864777 [Dentipellis sp. KUC8613]|nr:hypothetical protein DENSPDRAFT_864777 [Dentipellis sp. KUC8613]
MGLSGRKVKQRIGHDPRNLSWADNAAKFGQTYLSKLGWDPSQGLGAEGSGRTSAIKVSQKLDMLGIGMQHQRDANGIAWKQNKDFERLLARLNGKSEGMDASGIEGFDRATEEVQKAKKDEEEDDVAGEEIEETEKEKRKREKRARKEEKKKRKAREADVEDDGERKKRKKSKTKADDSASASGETKQDAESSASATPSADITTVVDVPIAAPAPRRPPPLSHRARNVAMKRLASRTPAALSEILGIPSSSIPSTPVPAAPEMPKLTDPNEGIAELEEMQKLTKATLSVADYFKEKLLAKSRPASANPSSSSSTARTPDAYDEDEERPRVGLGARGGLGSYTSNDDEPNRGGMGIGIAGSSKFAAMFSRASDGAGAATMTLEEQIEVVMEDVTATVETNDEKAERRKAKEERKREKEEKKKRRAKGDNGDDADEGYQAMKVTKVEKRKVEEQDPENEGVALEHISLEVQPKKKSKEADDASSTVNVDAKEKKSKRGEERTEGTRRKEKKSKKRSEPANT